MPQARPYSFKEFAEWIDQEGGYMSLIRHGVDDEDVPDAIKELWFLLTSIANDFDQVTNKISKIIGY